jgi:hypothetical protein
LPDKISFFLLHKKAAWFEAAFIKSFAWSGGFGRLTGIPVDLTPRPLRSPPDRTGREREPKNVQWKKQMFLHVWRGMTATLLCFALALLSLKKLLLPYKTV